jgi:hypothetical protein
MQDSAASGVVVSRRLADQPNRHDYFFGLVSGSTHGFA